MRKVIVAFFTFVLMAGAAIAGVYADGKAAEAKKAITNKVCPVMNAPVSEKYRAEYDGQYVYFCCQGCVTMFEKEPAKYIAELSAEDKEAIKANDVCPITNEKNPDRTIFVEHEGRKVYFCCQGCVNIFNKRIAEKKTE